MNRLILLAAALALAPLAALADDAPPPKVDVPKMDCTRPDLGGTKMTRDTGNHNPGADAQAYLKCVKAYAEQEKAQAQAHGEAANKAINEFNDFVKVFNDYQSGGGK